MSSTYFWDGKQLIAVQENIWIGSCEPYLDMPCVDTHHNPTDGGRYGVFTKDPLQKVKENHWVSQSLSELPPEFRANLLLLGVT